MIGSLVCTDSSGPVGALQGLGPHGADCVGQHLWAAGMGLIEQATGSTRNGMLLMAAGGEPGVALGGGGV